MSDIEQHSRYRLVETATFYPGTDLVTGGPTGPFIDTGFDIPLQLVQRKDARLYLSVATIKEMAQIAGLFEPEEPEVSKETQEYLAGYADALRDDLSGQLVDISDRLRFVADRLGGLAVESEPVPAPSEPQDDTAVPEPSGDDEPAGDGASAAVVDSEQSTDRQGSGTRRNKRPARVSSNTGDDDAFRI